MILKNYLKVVGVSSVVLLSSCATVKPPLPSQMYKIKTPAEREAALMKIKYWRVDGAFSIQQPHVQPVIANYTWQQYDRHSYRIEIDSALGLYRVAIYHRKGSVTLWKNSVHVYTAKTPEGLMEEVMGWSLPIGKLNDWIRGLPAPEKQSYYFAKYDKFGHLISLRQDGWTLTFGKYKTQTNGDDLPQLITMVQPKLNAKIAIKEWTLLTYRPPTPDAMA